MTRGYNPDAISPDQMMSGPNPNQPGAAIRMTSATPTMQQRIKALGVATPIALSSPVRRYVSDIMSSHILLAFGKYIWKMDGQSAEYGHVPTIEVSMCFFCFFLPFSLFSLFFLFCRIKIFVCFFFFHIRFKTMKKQINFKSLPIQNYPFIFLFYNCNPKKKLLITFIFMLLLSRKLPSSLF